MAYCAWRDPLRGLGRTIPWAAETRTPSKKSGNGSCEHAPVFQDKQFKRPCIPNAPKGGSGGALSPRGDYRAPSDSEAAVWLENAGNIPEGDEEVR
jgi:NAD+ synthase (glutamine-hydrolysing)